MTYSKLIFAIGHHGPRISLYSCGEQMDIIVMTVLEVLDDAVKIGLGGFIGWLIAKGTRSHEFEKERRRRKQDCLERVIEDLDEQESAFANWCASNLAHLKIRKTQPALEKPSLISVNQNYETSDIALTKLIRSKSKLIVFGFDECAAALTAYYDKVLHLTVEISAVREGEKELEVYGPGRADTLKSANSFREAVTKAFARL